MGKYILIDGNYQVYRAAFSGKKAFNQAGVFIGGSIVFLQMLRNLSEWGKPVVVFDHSRAPWRLDIFPDYKKRVPKSEEEQKEKELLSEPTFRIVKEIIPSLGIPMVIIPNQEGDDVLFRLSQGLVRDHHVLVVSDDKDYLQFCNHGVQVYQPMKDLFWTGKGVYEHEHGFNPESYVLYKALTGDKSDNLSNPPGVGPVAAQQIIQELTDYTVPGLIRWLDLEPDSKLKSKVRPHLSIIKRNWLLMNLDSIPLTVEEALFQYEQAKRNAIPNYHYILEKFKELEFQHLGSWLVIVSERMKRGIEA